MAKKKAVKKKRTRKTSGIKKLEHLEKKYVSVIEQNRLNQELSRLNKMIIAFGILSAVALLVIIYLVFVVFQVGQPLARQCEPYAAEQLHYKTEACTSAMQHVLTDYNEVVSAYDSAIDGLSPSCKAEILRTGVYDQYGAVVANTRNYVVE